MKKKIFYVGNHQVNSIHEVEENIANELVKTKDYMVIDNMEKWTEAQIKDFITSNKIPIDYIPKRDRKADVLLKLKEHGYC